MKALFGAAIAAALLGGTLAAQAAPVCLDTTRIQSTSVPDSHTILFHMNGGKVWKNTLKGPCPSLRVYGFAYEPTPSHEICGNMQSIRVLQSGAVCLLGSFELMPPKPNRGEP